MQLTSFLEWKWQLYTKRAKKVMDKITYAMEQEENR